MIEVLDVPSRHMKGTSASGTNYDFYIQKAKITSVDRDGIETSDVVEVQSEPGEVLPTGDDFIIDPTSYYVSTIVDKKGYQRKRILVPQNPKLVSFDALAKARGYVRQALKAA